VALGPAALESPQAESTDRRVVILGVLLSAVALTYFYAADHYIFSTRFMTAIFRYLLTVNDFKTAWLTLGVCILAACWKKPAPPIKVVDFIGSHAAGVAMASVVLFALGAVFIYHNNAFSMDEYAEVFQAKVFAAGRLSAQLPASVVDWLIPHRFNGGFLVASHTTGEAIEVFWPGFSMVLAPFEALGVPWLCNPCLAALAVFLIHRITLEITDDRRAAGWAVLFALASGAFAANAISYYSMQARLTANLLFVWLLLKPTPYRSFGAGVVGSFALALHSPFPHALFAAPWIIAMARTREQGRCLLALLVGYLPLLIIVGAGWMHMRGAITAGFDPITYNINAAFSFPDMSMIDMRAAAIVKMWIWAVPSLFLLAALGRLRRGDDYRVRLLTQSAVMTFVGYLIVIFDQGHGWGYRYFHSAWGVVPILAGCAMAERPRSNGRLAAFAGAAAMLNLFLVIPYQMIQIESIIARHSAQLPKPRRPGKNVYFIHDSSGFYTADLVQMDPLLREPDLLLFSRGPELDAELRRQNWPAGVLVERGIGVEEWSVGPTGTGPFVIAYSDRTPAEVPSP
jgi:hypothetical protein